VSAARSRLDRWVARRTGLSRRLAADAIRAGRVAVDGEVERDPGLLVPAEAAIALDGASLAEPPLLALFHKPTGVQCTVGDDRGRASLDTRARELLERGLHPVGRLDADTSGLVLFSADGALTQGLLHPRRAIERIYRAHTDPPPAPALADVLAAGVPTALGTFAARTIAMGDGWIELAVTEGKHRMVRRMLANAGHPVALLHRLAYGPVALGDLAPGAWRPATDGELAAARQAAGLG